MRKAIFIFIVILSVDFSFASELELAGFYQGKDIYLRNPYVSSENAFCIESVALNGYEIIVNPRVASIRIDLHEFSLNELVRISIIHSDQCTPDIINPEDLVWKEEFAFLSVSTDEKTIYWTTKLERENGKFIVQSNNQGIWESALTIDASGKTEASYTQSIDHIEEENLYRIIYEPEDGTPVISKTVDYVKILEPITFSPANVKNRINFSRTVFYEVLDLNGNQIFSGEDHSVNVKGLPRGNYLLYLDGRKFEFYKK
jgi:hypothetical protein